MEILEPVLVLPEIEVPELRLKKSGLTLGGCRLLRPVDGIRSTAKLFLGLTKARPRIPSQVAWVGSEDR